ncbi:MAG: DoxX family protein [Acidobacteriota bacterium]
MQSSIQTPTVSKTALWVGRILSGLTVLFFLLDGLMKLIKPEEVVKATVYLGYPESSLLLMGITLLVSTVLYMIPRTSIVGAILLTGYLGGATATHVRVGDSLFSILLPVIFGVLVWGVLFLRDQRLRALLGLGN